MADRPANVYRTALTPADYGARVREGLVGERSR